MLGYGVPYIRGKHSESPCVEEVSVSLSNPCAKSGLSVQCVDILTSVRGSIRSHSLHMLSN